MPLVRPAGAAPIIGKEDSNAPGRYHRAADYEAVIARLESLGSEENRAGMARFGINTERAFGISVTTLRGLAREIGRDHALAGRLRDSGFHEARMLATLIDDPKQITETQMEAWVRDFDSWDVCDGACGRLFWRTSQACGKAREWAPRSPSSSAARALP